MTTTETTTSVLRVRLVERVDPDPDLSYLEQSYSEVKSPVNRNWYRKQDRERLAAYNQGDWHMVGIYAEASVVVDGVKQVISSGGLWGVESDSARDYVESIAADEVAALKQILGQLGLSLPDDFSVETAEWVAR